MSAHRECRTVRIRWRQVAALVPAVVLAASGIALAWSGPDGAHQLQPARRSRQQALDQPDRTASSIEPAAVRPAGRGPRPRARPGPADRRVRPAARSWSGWTRWASPAPALAAYQLAAKLVDQADPACRIDWALVAAIGRVESDHARFGGNALDAQGIARPGIIGAAARTGPTARRGSPTPTTGAGTATPTYDRAVGPMQFIPGTWRIVGADADGDGARNPQDMYDAATATAIYLCSGPGDLRRDSDLYGAVKRYNNSDPYVRTVIAIADAYRHGVADAAGGQPARGAPGHGRTVRTSRPRARARRRPRTDRPTAAGSGADVRRRQRAAAAARVAPAGAPGSGHAVAAPPSPPPRRPLPGAVGSVGSAASSGVSSAVSLVTSVVTQVVKLPTPIVTTTTPCIINVLGIKVCTITTISSTTTTKTTTSTHRPDGTARPATRPGSDPRERAGTA